MKESRFFFFFNDTATTEIYTLSLHDALPICSSTLGWRRRASVAAPTRCCGGCRSAASWSRRSSATTPAGGRTPEDRKSTRLNSSHANISYAVFCLKKKKKIVAQLYKISILTL